MRITPQEHRMWKSAYSEKDVEKVLKMAKKYKISKAATKYMGSRTVRLNPVLGNMPVLGKMMRSGRTTLAMPTAKQQKFLKSKGVPVPTSSRAMAGKIFPARGGSASELHGIQKLYHRIGVGEKPVRKKLTPAQHKALNSVMLGHEVDELKVKPRPTFISAGHMSPAVILREHNRLTTMSPHLRAGTEGLKKVRGRLEEPAIRTVVRGYRHGESPRFSRHAIKRISEALERRMSE